MFFKEDPTVPLHSRGGWGVADRKKELGGVRNLKGESSKTPVKKDQERFPRGEGGHCLAEKRNLSKKKLQRDARTETKYTGKKGALREGGPGLDSRRVPDAHCSRIGDGQRAVKRGDDPKPEMLRKEGWGEPRILELLTRKSG